MPASTSLAFAPLTIGELTLPHRLALAPMSRLRASPSHVPSDQIVKYYEQRAANPGTLLVTEATLISQRAGGAPCAPGIYTPDQVAGWKRVVDAVHEKGSFVYLQLQALGRTAKAALLKLEEIPLEVVSASDVPFEGGDVPRALTTEEIAQYARDFAAAATAFIEEAGGDGVEINAGNGFLLDQFLQTNSNKRTDSYGGSVENRARFALEVVDAVVAAVGASKTAIRLTPFNEWQGMKMGAEDIEATFSYVVSQLKARHSYLAYLHLAEPSVSGIFDRAAQPGESLDFLASIWAPKPLLVAGKLTNAEEAERSLRKYDNSVAVFGRYFISNPDLVSKIKFGAELAMYDWSTVIVPGPENETGYTDYPAEYGPEGKL